MSPRKSLLERIGDALKGGADDVKETAQPVYDTAAQEVDQRLPDSVAKEAERASDYLQEQAATVEETALERANRMREEMAAKAAEEARQVAEAKRRYEAEEEARALREAQEYARAQRAAAAAAAAAMRTYKVQPGDSLSAIALEFYRDASRWPEIFAANRDKISDPNLIRVGQELVIP